MIKKIFFISISLLTTWSLNAQTYFGEQDTLFQFDGYSGNSISTCDIDGDGDIDFLVAPKSNDTLAWYENTDGKCTFGEPHIISDTANGSIKACDIDGDGDQDVIAASSNGLAWYENTDGEGTFGEPQIIPGFAGSVYVCDIDGDGDLDVFKAGTYELAWNENTDGKGTFGDQQIIPGFVGKVYFCDIDGDGDQDVLKAIGYEIAWNANTDGNGTFGEEQFIDRSVYISRSVIPCDMDGDGDPDILLTTGGWRTTGQDDYMTWYENTDGNGTFAKRANIITYTTYSVGSVNVCDIDGDGDLDFLATRTGHYGGNGLWDGSYQIAWYENADGNGTFGAVHGIINGWVSPHDPVCVLSVHTYDIDGDGDQDVLSATSFNDKIAWYINTDGHGTFDGEQILVGSTDFPQSARTCDIDGDGDQDVFSRSSFSKTTIAWYENFIFTGVPEILEQPQSVEVCLGDTATFTVITDKEYYYQWHIKCWDESHDTFVYIPIEGETSNTLTIRTDELESPFDYIDYYVRIASTTDTIWSNRAYLVSMIIPQMDDTIYMCNPDQRIKIKPTFYSNSNDLNFNWSPEMSPYEVPDYGKYWVEITNTREGITCNRTDTFVVAPPPPVVYLSGTYYNFQYLCSDSIFISGNTNMDAGFFIDTGATVIFKDDFELDAYYMIAKGAEQDSIQFSCTKSGQGSIDIDNFTGEYSMRNELEYLSIKNFSFISLDYLKKSKVSGCSLLRVEDSDSCLFYENRRVNIHGSIKNSLVSEADSLFAITSSVGHGPSEFGCRNCLFENNKSGLKINGPFAYIRICNNRFYNNEGTPLIINGETVTVGNNIFSDNISTSGSGVCDLISAGSLAFINNTMFHNQGDSSNGIQIGLAPYKTYLYNNIYWNDPNSGTDKEIVIKELHPSSNAIFQISNSILRNGLNSFILPGGSLIDSSTIINAYPDFVDTSDNNLQLQCGSPAIDAGIPVDGTDIIGNPRNSRTSTDIGAYEKIPNCYPEILYQSGDTNLFIGDTLRLKIQTSDTCDYSWFLNSTLLAVEKDTCLVIDSIVLADTGEYKVRISNLTDTIWSAPMHVMVYPYTRTSVLPDSLYLCPDSIEISIDLEGINFLWSTGDTTSSITVNETGSYWVQLTDSLGLYLTDSVVVYRPSSIEISGNYGYGYEFCADTLLVVGNCEFGRVNLKPGTFILFTGNYTIKLDWFESDGTETDSIIFCGSLLLNDTIKQGNLIEPNIGYWKEPPSSLNLTRLVNLKSVAVTRAEKCSFRQCHSVHLVYSNSNKLLRNDIVHFDYKVDSCQVVENKLLRFYFYYDRWYSQQYYFDCTNSTFLRNSSGLNTGGRGILHIENCRFIENEGPVVNYPVYSIDKYEIPSVSIRYNKFYKNIGNILVFDFMGPEYSYVGITNNEFIENEGIAVSCNDPEYLTVSNNLFVKNRTSSGPGSIYYYNSGKDKPVTIKNNTFVGNLGETFGCMEFISDTTCPINMIANNIFWDNSATLSAYAVGINFVNPPSEVCELNLTHSVAMDTSKIAFISGEGFELAPKNSFNLYPEFVDTLNDNYRLTSYSPYIDMGTGSPGGTDLDGNPRVFGNAVDIGAYEYIPSKYPEILYSPKEIFFCTEDSTEIQIETNDCFAYQWYKNSDTIEGATSNWLMVRNPDAQESDFYLLRINSLADTIWSDPIEVSLKDKPVVTTQTDSIAICTTGDTLLGVAYISDLPVTIKWFSELSGELTLEGDSIALENLVSDDNIYAIVSNDCGTDTTDIIPLTVLDLPKPDLGRDTAIFANEKIILNAGSGYPHYLWDDNSIGQYRVAYAGDTVWCRVTNEAGCVAADTLIVFLNPLNSNNILLDQQLIKIYPSPLKDVLTIELPEEIELPCTLRILNISGELIQQEELHTSITKLPVGKLRDTGLYFLIIRNESFCGTWKIMVEP